MAILLAQVAVASGASNITAGNITDKRAYTVPPGCVLPIATAAAAPSSGGQQVMYDIATRLLVRGTGTAGQVAGTGYAQLAGMDLADTSSGGEGLTPGTPTADPWGIGYGEIGVTGGGGGGGGKGGGGGGGGGGGTTDGTLATELAVTFAADGTSDYEVHVKWASAVPAQAYTGTLTLTAVQVTFAILIDGVQVDSVSHLCSASPLRASGGGSMSWYTSGSLGTTLPAGVHTAALAVETAGSDYSAGPASGVFVGDFAGSAGTIFSAPSGWTSALTAENCALRVIAVPAA